MTATDVVWWAIATRAVLGSVLTALAIVLLAFTVIEYVLRRYRKENGGQGIVLSHEIPILACCVHGLGSLASTAWLTWPFVVARSPYTTQQAIVSVMVLSLLCSFGAIILLKFNMRRLLGRHFKGESHDQRIAKRLSGDGAA